VSGHDIAVILNVACCWHYCFACVTVVACIQAVAGILAVAGVLSVPIFVSTDCVGKFLGPSF
jgi:hypothetical protein